MTIKTHAQGDRVLRIRHCELRAGDGLWPWAIANADGIDRHWTRESARNANYFNGAIHLIDAFQLDEPAGHVSARLLKTDFKSYLYWRDMGFPDAGILDGFGSALIRAGDGAYVLGRQRPGNINSGLAYLPGGFIDPRDVATDGTIDIRASVVREVYEETGLSSAELVEQDGYVLTLHGPHVSLAVPYVSALSADELVAKIGVHIAAGSDPELSEAVAVRSQADLAALPMPDHARRLIMWLLD
jgi:8-oxo-dGTP pyrophosphatase MutT (NUDIX family)